MLMNRDDQIRQAVFAYHGHSREISGLQIPDLFPTALLIPTATNFDTFEVDNGLCLSKFQHTDYDPALLGINTGAVINISES